MSHFKERTEKNCLNCGTIVEGRFCQHCGQENLEPKESFWSLMTHFVYDITHFDGKFFSTLKYLLFKPGYLSLEYIKGRRASYLHPIRMYIFTSAFFFVIFFTLYNAKSLVNEEKTKQKEKKEQVDKAIRNLEASYPKSKDSSFKLAAIKVLADLRKEKDSLDRLETEDEDVTKDSVAVSSVDILKDVQDSLAKEGINIPVPGKKKEIDFAKDGFKYDVDSSKDDNFGISEYNVNSVLAYQRIQQELPKEKRDGWVKRSFITQVVAAVEGGEKQGKQEYIRAFVDNLLHSFPKMLFVSLPLFALFLKMLYWRRKDLYYADHVIFTIHVYCATFIFLLGWFALLRLDEATNWSLVGWLVGITIFLIYLYHYKSMRGFYGQSRKKTLVKFLLLNMMSFFMMVLLLTIFTAISATQLSGSH